MHRGYVKSGLALVGIIGVQVVLGIITLVSVAPVEHLHIAAGHQMGAVLVLTVLVAIMSHVGYTGGGRMLKKD
jgi:heme A synthase